MTALSSRDICSILKTAAGLNVASLKIEAIGLDVTFVPPAPKVETVECYGSPIDLPTITPPSAPNAAHSPPESGELVVFDEVERDPKEIAAEQDLDELLISDPLELEERIARGELVNVEDEDD